VAEVVAEVEAEVEAAGLAEAGRAPDSVTAAEGAAAPARQTATPSRSGRRR
jgi:hypothetical protein